MRTFPTTQTANLGGTACGRTFDEWATELTLDADHPLRREHFPDYVEIVEARLSLEGDNGSYTFALPRKRIAVELAGSSVEVDLTEGIAAGRHTLTMEAPDGADFAAQVRIRLTRPTVDVRDGGYVIPFDLLKYSHRHWLEDDRAAQRVGRHDFYIKSLPVSYADTPVTDRLTLAGEWRMKAVGADSLDDYSAMNVDDSGWDSVVVPHTWETDASELEGPVWYRKRIQVADDWEGRLLALRFSGIDDEPTVFVNGHEAGYNCGWHRSFQLDVTDLVVPGEDVLIAIRVNGRRPVGGGGGIIYPFIKEWAIVTYPEKTAALGGLFGETNELAAVENFGPVVFEPRIHPAFEGLATIRFFTEADKGPAPLAMGSSSSMTYRPPYIRYDRLGPGGDVTMMGIAGFDRDVMGFEVQGGGRVTAEIAVDPIKLGGMPEISVNGNSVEVTGDNGFHFVLSGPPDAVIDVTDGPIIRFVSPTAASDLFALYLVSGSHLSEQMMWLSECDDPFGYMEAEWEQGVYRYAVPKRMTPEVEASIRTCKQALTLNARLIPGDPQGLLTDPIKYPVFWLRDAAISSPGALYAGEIAHRAAVETAADVFRRASINTAITILRPDGTIRQSGIGAQTNSDSVAIAVYAIYRAWCQRDDEWLRDAFETVKVHLGFLNELETRFGNTADGIIRSSDGDWADFSFKRKYEREGASIFVNVMYLRALKYGVRMAEAVGDDERATLWQRLFESGRSLLSKPIEEGGLLLKDQGHLAETIQTLEDEDPNGWKYPDDLDEVTVFTGFRPMPHCIAMTEGLIEGDLVDEALRRIDDNNILRPFPASVQYPWNDYMEAEGVTGEYEATAFGRKWKCLPGCHAPGGGRWAYAGGLVQLGLWRAGAGKLAREAKQNQAGYLKLARQPARIFEDAHFSGLFRNEAGDPKDAEGFYYNWGAATPLEAMVEGEYGVVPVPEGVRISPEHCGVGDGISAVPIRGGEISYRRDADNRYTIELRTGRDGCLTFVSPVGGTVDITTDGINVEARVTEEGAISFDYSKDWQKITVTCLEG